MKLYRYLHIDFIYTETNTTDKTLIISLTENWYRLNKTIFFKYSSATGLLIFNWKYYHVSKPEMELHMINIMYAALPMREQTEKTTFSCKDD